MKKGNIWLAVDTSDLRHARKLVAQCADMLSGVKLGLEFFVAHGPAGVREVIADSGLPLFLDLKLHDIPNTVAKAVASAAALHPALLTIHALGGGAMIAAARAAGGADTRIIAVSVLTSMDGDDLAGIGIAAPPAEAVTRLAALARTAGAHGLVCSPHEAALVRDAWPDAFLVVPGVRPDGSGTGDQKRVMTPAAALAAGADALVIGRPITHAADPAAAARAIVQSL